MSSYARRIAGLSSNQRAVLNARLDARDGPLLPIAIIGVGCRFPGAPSPEAFWRLLEGGVDAISEVPGDRFDVDAFFDSDPGKPGKMNTRWGGFLEQVDRFDANFFGISPREAARMDPQQRLMLEVAWEALEDAGQVAERLEGTATGVFVGIATNDYARLQLRDANRIDGYVGIGSAGSIAANRISYVFDLKGPSIAIDTSCSSSLVAVHWACQSLWRGESTLALAGGVNLILSPDVAINFTKAGVMAPDGRCKAFDSRANGYVRSEGAGMIVLKPLTNALSDGDPIYAVVIGTATNQDGRTNGLMAPNRFSQEAVLRKAYACAGVSAGDIQYVEAHGTGTLLGDPIEAAALGAVLSTGRPAGQPCALGTVKTNIGHLEAAAGIAGLIKVALALKHGQIPPNLHFLDPNPHIPFGSLPLRVQEKLEPWPSRDSPALAGVSSFGFGGTNAHVVLEEAPDVAPDPPGHDARNSNRAAVLSLSARSPAALLNLARRYLEFLPNCPGLSFHDICYTSGVRRSHSNHRLALAAGSKAEAQDGLEAFLAGETRPSLATGSATYGRKSKLVFVFSGQGSQWLGMGRELLEREPQFAKTIERCNEAMPEFARWSLSDALRAASPIEDIDVVQPVLFAVQVALSEVWRSWGVEPDAVVGHSMGEIAAAHFAGILSLHDALRIVCWRSRLMKRLSGAGAMAVVELSVDRVQDLLAGYPDRLSVAASNSPTSTVVSGMTDAVEEVVAILQRQQVFCRLVQVDVAAHSSQLESLRQEMLQGLEGIQPLPAKVPFFSTVTQDTVITFDPFYWWRNMRDTVQFDGAVQRLLKSDHTQFLEISPHPILLTAIMDTFRSCERKGTALPSLRRGAGERATLLGSLGALYATGWPVDWSRLYAPQGRCVPLPSYPWDQERFWFDSVHVPADSASQRTAPPLQKGKQGHPLLGQKVDLAGSSGEHFWESILSPQRIPWVLDHCVQETIVLPGAAYVEMALAAAVMTFGSETCILSDIHFHKALFLANDAERRVQTVLSITGPGSGTCQVYSNSAGSDADEGTWVLHTTARIGSEASASLVAQQVESVDSIRGRLEGQVSGQQFYAEVRKRGNEYGPRHQGIGQIWHAGSEALAAIHLPPELSTDLAGYQFHPAVLDAVWQALGATLLFSQDGEKIVGPTVPVQIDRLIVRTRPAGKSWSFARLRTNGDGVDHIGDVDLLDEAGLSLVETRGLRLRPLDNLGLGRKTDLDGWLYELNWQASMRSPLNVTRATPAAGPWLILADRGGVAQQLAEVLKARDEACVLVHQSGAFERLSPAHYKIRPTSSDDLLRMLRGVLGESPADCRGVVHLWSLDLPPLTEGDAGALEPVDLACGSAANLVQTLVKGQVGRTALWFVTRGAQPVQGARRLALEQAPLWGLARAISQEHPSFWGGLIDLDPASAAADAAAAIFSEVDDPQGEDQIAYRAGTRFVARLQRKRESTGSRVQRWRSDAAYLITGGLGDLGLEVARWMVGQGARRLILLGRTKLPPPEQWSAQDEGTRPARQIAAIQELEAKGAEVRLAFLDVADEQQLASFLKQYRDEGAAPIRGVVHAAGLVSMGAVAELKTASLHETLRPKILGAWLLHRLLRDSELDFFVLFSSFASVLSSPQLGAYAAANAFLDSLAHRRRAEQQPALAINWAAWSDVGMAARYLREGHALLRGVESFTPAQGLDVLGRLMNQDSPQVAVARVDWQSWRRLYPAFSRLPLLAKLMGEGMPGAAEPDRSERARIHASLLAAGPDDRPRILETYLQKQAARVLGLPVAKLDVHRSFTMAGFDSLMAVEFRNRVEADLGISLPLVDLLQGPSVVQLGARLLEQVMASRLLSAEVETAAELSSESDWEILKL